MIRCSWERDDNGDVKPYTLAWQPVGALHRTGGAANTLIWRETIDGQTHSVEPAHGIALKFGMA